MSLRLYGKIANFRQPRRVDGCTGVMYGQQQGVGLGVGGHGDFADILALLHAVLDGVFNQWLQGEVGQIPAFQRTVRVQRKDCAALIAQLLDLNIAAHQLHVSGGGGVLLGRERRPQHIAQVNDEPPGVLVLAGTHKPAQRA